MRFHNQLTEEQQELMRRAYEAHHTPRPPTALGHLSTRTMADPCPCCGGTEYYCAHMVDQVLTNEDRDFDAVLRNLSDLYSEFCKFKPEHPYNNQFRLMLARLMDAYNRWLG